MASPSCTNWPRLTDRMPSRSGERRADRLLADRGLDRRPLSPDRLSERGLVGVELRLGDHALLRARSLARPRLSRASSGLRLHAARSCACSVEVSKRTRTWPCGRSAPEVNAISRTVPASSARKLDSLDRGDRADRGQQGLPAIPP